MDGSDNKLRNLSLLILVLVSGVLFLVFKSMKVRTIKIQEADYVMPRVQGTSFSDYDLSQRQVHREQINPFEKIENQLNQAKANPVTQKTAPATKKENTKNKAQSKTDKKKQTGVETRVVERADDGGLSPSAEEPINSYAFQKPPQAKEAKKSNEGTAQQNNPDNEDRMSAEQWRALLQSEPTFENMKKLIQATSEQKVPVGEFYMIIEDLLASQNPQTQSVGLFGAQAMPSAQSFSIIARHYELFSEQTKKFADQILFDYNQPQLLSSISQALQSSEEVVALKAGEILQKGIQDLRSGTPTSSRTPRGGSVAQAGVTQYNSMIPLLQQLSASPQGSIAQMASSILAQIQSLQTIATSSL